MLFTAIKDLHSLRKISVLRSTFKTPSKAKPSCQSNCATWSLYALPYCCTKAYIEVLDYTHIKMAIHETWPASQSNHGLLSIWSSASCKQAAQIPPVWWLSSWSRAGTAPHLLASRALISSINPLPPKGRGPFPRPPSVLDEAEPPPPPLELEESSPFRVHKKTADVPTEWDLTSWNQQSSCARKTQLHKEWHGLAEHPAMLFSSWIKPTPNALTLAVNLEQRLEPGTGMGKRNQSYIYPWDFPKFGSSKCSC